MNLLSLIQNQLSPQTIGQISNAVGESAEGTQSALGTAFPALLGSLLGKAGSSPSGVTDIFNMLKQGQAQGGGSGTLSNIMGALSGGAPSPGAQSMLGSLLGPKLGPVSDFIASHCGIRGSSATSLLGMAAPFLMHTIGQQVSSQNLGPAGLGQLLSSQAPYLKDLIPSGLANTLGIGKILSGSTDTQRVETATATARPAQPAYQTATAAHEPARSGGILKWAWVPLLLALAGWFAVNHMNRAPQGGTAETTTTTTGQATSQPYSLANLSHLNLTPGGIADNLAKAVSSGDWNKTVDLQGFTTDSTGALSDSAKSSVQEIGRLMTAVPNLKVRITGHGDSQEAGVSQANAIKSALTSVGISDDRIMTSGETGTGVPSLSLVH